MVSWDPVPLSSLLGGSQYAYQIIYRPLFTTTVQIVQINDIQVSETTLSDLRDSTRYEFYIRLVCTSGMDTGVGPLGVDPVPLTLVATCMFVKLLQYYTIFIRILRMIYLAKDISILGIS